MNFYALWALCASHCFRGLCSSKNPWFSGYIIPSYRWCSYSEYCEASFAVADPRRLSASSISGHLYSCVRHRYVFFRTPFASGVPTRELLDARLGAVPYQRWCNRYWLCRYFFGQCIIFCSRRHEHTPKSFRAVSATASLDGRPSRPGRGRTRRRSRRRSASRKRKKARAMRSSVVSG